MISVIVPVYNVAEYLCECVDSILKQTFTDFELILVDDGSTDKSGRICDELKCNDQRIRVIHKENGGLSSARNIGLNVALGDFVFFVDSDDKLPHSCLSELHEAICKNQADICIGNYERFDTDEKNAQTNVDWNGIKVIHGVDVPNVYLNYGGYYVVAWNKLYKREMFSDIRYPEGKLHEDEFIAHELWEKADTICCLSNVVYFYRFNANSIMNSSLTVNRLDSIEAYYNRISYFRRKRYIKQSQMVEYLMWKDLNCKYYRVDRAKNTKRLKEIQTYIKNSLRYLLKNEKFSVKEKVAILVFCLNSKIYGAIWGKTR